MPKAEVTNKSGVIAFAGDWLASLPRPVWEDYIAANPPSAPAAVATDGLGRWDSTLLVFIARLLKEYEHAGVPLDWKNLPHGLAKIIRLSRAGAKAPPPQPPAEKRLPEQLGTWILDIYDTFLQVAEMIGGLVLATCALLTGRSQMRLTDLRTEIHRCGPQALPIISLISFLMGLIMAFIGSIPLKWFAAENYVASLVGIGMLRLMMPVMVAVVMAGRNGAAYAAELGAMEVNEEIDALRTLGINPLSFLALPRFLAMTLMLPLLCVYAGIISIYGGLFVAVVYLRQTSLAYITTLYDTTRTNDLLVGELTAFVLGMCVAICGCYHGMHCKRTAAAVGNAATSAVVDSIVCIVVAVSLITVITVLFKL